MIQGEPGLTHETAEVSHLSLFPDLFQQEVQAINHCLTAASHDFVDINQSIVNLVLDEDQFQKQFEQEMKKQTTLSKKH